MQEKKRVNTIIIIVFRVALFIIIIVVVLTNIVFVWLLEPAIFIE